MKIEDILQKQGEYYKNLSTNETIQKCNETIKAQKITKSESDEELEEILNNLQKSLNKTKKAIRETKIGIGLGGASTGLTPWGLYYIPQFIESTGGKYASCILWALFSIGITALIIASYNFYKNTKYREECKNNIFMIRKKHGLVTPTPPP